MINTAKKELANDCFFSINLILLAYISVSLKAYKNLKSSGLLDDKTSAKRYYLYIFFWQE